ncbi:hypothetical protein DBR42_22465 [Pelomonas sp. HMWF004]|nr:hypothetical protein DBR42_22465 [Pelomonas sp. HMWF004]
MTDTNTRNAAFVNFAAACLGQVSRNFRRIDFAMLSESAYRVRVVLREESSEDRAALQEMVEDFEAMTRDFEDDRPFEVTLETCIEPGQLRRPTEDIGYLGLYCESEARRLG